MTRTPDEIKKGLECCSSTANCADGCPYHVIVEGSFGCDEMGCEDGLLPDALALIQQLQAENAEKDERIRVLEAERDELKEALGLMVYQYCVRGDKLDHLYMCAGETAFRVLGLEQYGNTSTLEGWLFPEFQDKEE